MRRECVPFKRHKTNLRQSCVCCAVHQTMMPQLPSRHNIIIIIKKTNWKNQKGQRVNNK